MDMKLKLIVPLDFLLLNLLLLSVSLYYSSNGLHRATFTYVHINCLSLFLFVDGLFRCL